MGSKPQKGRIRRIVILSAVAAPLFAAEGMWPYNHLPLDQIEQDFGYRPTPEFLSTVQKASVRFNNGGSGSFVSPSGLAMTNHHVAADCIRKLSSEDKDYIADGFYASSQAKELKCPDLELNVLMEIETVTDKVNKGVTPETSDAKRLEAQRSATAQIEKDCRDSTLMRCDVVNLYQGGIFDLYKYQRYTDVRLVFAPEFASAYYGGDPDNFTFPRYCMDVSFLRVYKDGKPLEPPAFMPLNPNGAENHQLTFVSGHPGTTKRLLTGPQLAVERDRRTPLIMDFLKTMAGAVSAYGRTGGDAPRQARDAIFSYNNSIKAYTGRLAGLRDQSLFAEKQAQEKSLREAVAADADLAAKYGEAWDKIAAAQRVSSGIYEEYSLIDSLGFYTRYFTLAKTLYRLAKELPKPNGERLPEYGDTRLESLDQQLYSAAPIYPELEIVKLAASLTFMRDRLSRNHPIVKQVIGNRRPEDVARKLIESTKLADVDFRKSLGADKAAAALDSDDPMIALVRSIDDEARALRKRFEDEVEAVETAQGSKIAQARFAVSGTDVYPDATFTLRLAFGRVSGYFEERKAILPFTKMEGLYEKHTGEDPYALPKKVLDAKDKVDPESPYNLVTTNDITGGNSGSPLIDQNAQVVGLIFDGNIQSLSNDFLYSEKQGRAVSVDVRGILHSLDKVYNARRLGSELKAARASSAE